jgi:hypothetical protein
VVIAPADATYDYQGKATGFRQAGHECDVIRLPCDDPAHEASPPFALPLASDRYDLVELGEFGRITVGHERRSAFVRELLRICKPDGVVVAPLGNRLCPLNLSGGRLAIHGPWARTLLGFAQVQPGLHHRLARGQQERVVAGLGLGQVGVGPAQLGA